MDGETKSSEGAGKKGRLRFENETKDGKKSESKIKGVELLRRDFSEQSETICHARVSRQQRGISGY